MNVFLKLVLIFMNVLKKGGVLEVVFKSTS